MRIVHLKCEDDRLCFDQSIHTIAVARETDQFWFGRPIANPACPELQWPKFAWKQIGEEEKMTNVEKFRAVYLEKLTVAVQKHPDEYFYGVDKVPGVVEKMIPALAKGGANIEGAVKATARALGIKPTMGAIRAFLNALEE